MVEPLECVCVWGALEGSEVTGGSPFEGNIGIPTFSPISLFSGHIEVSSFTVFMFLLHHRLKSSATHQPGADPTKLNQKKPLKPVSSMFLSQQ